NHVNVLRQVCRTVDDGRQPTDQNKFYLLINERVNHLFVIDGHITSVPTMDLSLERGAPLRVIRLQACQSSEIFALALLASARGSAGVVFGRFRLSALRSPDRTHRRRRGCQRRRAIRQLGSAARRNEWVRS